MNYTELTQLIQDTLENSEASFVANIPVFVRAAEERIYLLMKLPAQRVEQTGNVSLGSANLSTPSGFLGADSLRVTASGVTYPLLPKEPDFLKEAYPDSTQGRPKYYAVFNDQTIRLAPIPDSAYAYVLHYTKNPSSIVDAGTSWIGTHASGALLYGALIEAYTYMKGEPDILEMYASRFAESVGTATKLADRERTDEFRSNRNIPVT
jgi:hypothetical protein